MRTLPELLFASERRFGNLPALAIRRGLRTEVWTYRSLAGQARVAAARLAHLGVQPGDRIMALAPNTPELVVSMFGVWLAGGVLVPIDARTPVDVLVRVQERTEPRLLLGEQVGGLSQLPTIAPAELADGHSAEARPAFSGPVAELAELVFTSGTTGTPKGVMLTHANILANVSSALDALPVRAGERLLSLLPLSHMMEQTAGLLAPLASGATVFYSTSRRSTALLAAMQRHQIGLLVCVPEVLQFLMAGIQREVDRTGKRQVLQRLLETADRLPIAMRPILFGPVHRQLGGRFRLVLCGGAPLSADLWRTWERFGVRVIQGYGATECAPIVTSNRLNHRLPAAVGWPVQGVDVRLAADAEVLVRGPNVMLGYWRDEAATSAVLDDGWYRTGDLGAFGPRGELRLHGRKKDMIVLADGRNVFPEDVEEELRTQAGVRECVVLGKPRPDGGEEVHAVIVPAASAEDARVAVRGANARLGPHQQIGGLTIWTDADLPRTLSLKVKRNEVLAAIETLAVSTPAPAQSQAPVSIGGSLEERLVRIVAHAAGRDVAEVRPEADLVLDLGLDSLARVELAVSLEEELGRSIPDEAIVALRTVADLLAAVEQGTASTTRSNLSRWPRGDPASAVRALVQSLVVFPLLGLCCRPRVIAGAEHLRALAGPAVFIANHTSHLDAPTVLAALPPACRRRTAVAAAADYFFRNAMLGTFASLTLGAFPFRREGAVSASLADCGDLVDEGYNILIFPEGTRSPSGQLAEFKMGIGLLARELNVPVVPVHLSGLQAILPKGRTWPHPGPVAVRIGEPVRVARTLSNAEATAMLEAAVRRLAARTEPT